MKRELLELKKSFSILLGGTLVASVIGLLNTAIIARSLSPELFGIFAILISFTLIIDKLVNFQSWQGLIKYISPFINDDKNFTDVDSASKVINSCILLDIITAIVGYFLSIAIIEFLFNHFNWSKIEIFEVEMFLFTMLFKFSSFSLGLYRVLNKNQTQVYINIFCAILRLLIVIFLAFNNSGIKDYLYAWAVTEAIQNVLLCVYAIRLVNSRCKSKIRFKAGLYSDSSLYKFVVWTNITAVVDLPAKELDVFLVGLLSGEKEAGFYKLAKQCMALVGRCASPLYQAIYPIQVKFITNHDPISAVKISNTASKKLLILSSFIVIFCFIFAEQAIVFLLGSEYYSLVDIAILAVAIKALDTIFTTYHSLFIAFGYVRQSVIILMISNFIMLIGFYLYVPSWGSLAALYCILFQAIMTFSLKFIYIKGIINES